MTGTIGTVRLAGLFLAGHVASDHGAAPVVELLLDGLPHAVARADLFDHDLAAAGADDPFRGFVFALVPAVLDRTRHLAVRLANTDRIVGSVAVAPKAAAPIATLLGPGEVRWRGGLRLEGWLPPDAPADTTLTAIVDGDRVAEARPGSWLTLLRDGTEVAVRAFELTLPDRLADGRVHRVTVRADAVPLTVDPLPVLSFPDGLAAFLADASDVPAERLRGALYDRLMPQSVPFGAVDAWLRSYPPPGEAAAGGTVAVLAVGEAPPSEAVATSAGCPVLHLPALGGTFAPAALAALLRGSAATAEAVIFMSSGASLLPGAAPRLARAALEGGAAYPDVLVVDGTGGMDPVAQTAFDPERAVEQGYASACFALSRGRALAAAAEGASSLHALFLAGSDVRAGAPGGATHLPGFAARLPASDAPAPGALHAGARRLGVLAEDVAGGLRLRRGVAQRRVSVVVPVSDRESLNRVCEAVRAQRSRHVVEIVAVDAGLEPCLAEGAKVAGIHLASAVGERNRARAWNTGAAVASGEALLFIHPDLRFADADAIDELVDRLGAPGVAVVGGVLTWAGGAVREAGLVLDFAQGARPALAGCAPGDPGYAGLLGGARRVSAVSSDLMLVDGSAFAAAGGFDARRFPLHFPHVALSLTVGRNGWRTVLTPYVRAMLQAPADPLRAPEDDARRARELSALRHAFAEDLANDPCYSPLLNRDGPTHTGLASPPGAFTPRLPGGASDRAGSASSLHQEGLVS